MIYDFMLFLRNPATEISTERRERVQEKLKAREKARLTYREILQRVIDKPLLLPPHCTTVSEHTVFQAVYL